VNLEFGAALRIKASITAHGISVFMRCVIAAII